MPSHPSSAVVRFDPATSSLHIVDLRVEQPAVTIEALRWSTGRRGEPVAADGLRDADLSAFAQQSLVIGATAISAAGGAVEAANLAALVDQLGDRAARSADEAAMSTKAAVEQARKSVVDAASLAKDAITAAGVEARKSFTHEVAEARVALLCEITRLLGGESPELATRLSGVLDSFGKDVQARSATQIDEVIRKAAKAFDPTDPDSPMAKHQAALQARHDELATLVGRHHEHLAREVRALAEAIRVEHAAATARGQVASLTPLKGATFEDGAGSAVEQIASSLGEEFVVTGSAAGSLPTSKKGDGVVVLAGGVARIVVEMHNGSGRRDWNGYLEEAERNRDAVASLGIVPDLAANVGQSLRVLGPRRLVLAYTPGDDESLLRSAVVLLRLLALASVRGDAGADLALVRQRLTEATAALSMFAVIRKNAGAILRSVTAIDRDADALETTLHRLLTQAATALEGISPGEQPAAAIDTGDVA
jgi:hypothetical protein